MKSYWRNSSTVSAIGCAFSAGINCWRCSCIGSGGEGDKTYTVEFTADYGQTLFLRLEEIYYYNVSIAGNGDMAYVKLLNDGSYRSSCQYEPAK